LSDSSLKVFAKAFPSRRELLCRGGTREGAGVFSKLWFDRFDNVGKGNIYRRLSEEVSTSFSALTGDDVGFSEICEDLDEKGGGDSFFFGNVIRIAENFLRDQ